MRIIGIDPGYDRLGVAVVEKENGKETLVHSECVQTSSQLPFPDRLQTVGDSVERVIREYAPEHLAIENVFFNTNQKTAMDVAAVRGVVLYVGRTHGLKIFEYTPPQIKSAIAGSGRANKKDITIMLHHLIHIDKTIKLDDEYDAIAVALTHGAILRVV